MFDFRKICFEDKEWITKCLAVSDFRGAEYCFANNMAWQRLNDTVITHHGDFYISCSFEDGQPYFTFPAGVKIDADGKEKYIRLFDELKEYVSTQGKPLIVSSVTDDNLSWIKEYYGDKIICEYDRNSSDYIYNASDLIELKGKKYHGKRNHIKRFMDEPWEYRVLNFRLSFIIRMTTLTILRRWSSNMLLIFFLRIWIGWDLKVLCFTEMIK